MPRLRRKPMPTYLYNRFGIQAEVEVTKDKVGNFLKSLVDDSGKRKGDRGDLMLQCWLLHAPQMLPAIKTLWWLLLALQNLVQRLPSSTLQQRAFNCPYWLARKIWKLAVQTGLDRHLVRTAFRRNKKWRACPREQVCLCLHVGPCAHSRTLPQLPTWAERLLCKFSTNHNHFMKIFFPLRDTNTNIWQKDTQQLPLQRSRVSQWPHWAAKYQPFLCSWGRVNDLCFWFESKVRTIYSTDTLTRCQENKSTPSV